MACECEAAGRTSGAFLVCHAYEAQVHMCIAPGVDPGRIRLVRALELPPFGIVVASLTPTQALALGNNIVLTAKRMIAEEA